MNPYSHLYFAAVVADVLQPRSGEDYYFGAVAADIRYLAGVKRSQTHRKPKEVKGWLERHPELDSFIKGYLVHALLDDVDLTLSIGKTLPIRVLGGMRRKPFTQTELTTLLELYLIRQPRPPLAFGGAHNALLDELGIEPRLTETFSAAMGEYLAHPSIDTALASYRKLGMIDDARVERYARAARGMQNPAVQAVLFWGVRSSKIVAKVEGYLRRHL